MRVEEIGVENLERPSTEELGVGLSGPPLLAGAIARMSREADTTGTQGR
jgi:hypothetical protein